MTLPLDVLAPLVLVGAVTVALVLDRDLPFRIGEVGAAEQFSVGPHLVLNDGFGQPVVDEEQPRLGLLRRLHPFAGTGQRRADRAATREPSPFGKPTRDLRA